jgi:ABC-type amino acid transport substrate-binding protein
MEYYQDGILTGFEIEWAELIAQRLGKKATFVHMGYHSLKPALEKGFIDAIA